MLKLNFYFSRIWNATLIRHFTTFRALNQTVSLEMTEPLIVFKNCDNEFQLQTELP